MTAIAYDIQRTEDLEAIGYLVMQVWNHEVYNNMQGVVEKILNLLDSVPLDKIPSSPALLPKKREKGAAP